MIAFGGGIFYSSLFFATTVSVTFSYKEELKEKVSIISCQWGLNLDLCKSSCSLAFSPMVVLCPGDSFCMQELYIFSASLSPRCLSIPRTEPPQGVEESKSSEIEVDGPEL